MHHSITQKNILRFWRKQKIKWRKKHLIWNNQLKQKGSIPLKPFFCFLLEIRALPDNSLSRKNQSPNQHFGVCVVGFFDWLVGWFGLFPPRDLLRGYHPLREQINSTARSSRLEILLPFSGFAKTLSWQGAQRLHVQLWRPEGFSDKGWTHKKVTL